MDDIYLQTTGEEMTDQFQHTVNNLHPKLKFEIDKPEITPNGFPLSLLDFKVTISKDGKSSFEFYKNPAKKPLFRPNCAFYKKHCLLNHRYILQSTLHRLHREHVTLYVRSFKRTHEQRKFFRKETHLKVPKLSLQRHRDQDYRIRKRARKSTPVRRSFDYFSIS